MCSSKLILSLRRLLDVIKRLRICRGIFKLIFEIFWENLRITLRIYFSHFDVLFSSKTINSTPETQASSPKPNLKLQSQPRKRKKRSKTNSKTTTNKATTLSQSTSSKTSKSSKAAPSKATPLQSTTSSKSATPSSQLVMTTA